MITTEDRILDAAKHLFFRHGIRSITMDDIATHLGMSKKTIYQSFEDKDSLVDLLTQTQMNCQVKDMHDIRRESDNSIHEMMHVMNYMAGTFSRINPTLFYDLQKYHSMAWRHFKKFKEKELTVFIEENLRRGIRQELYRKDLKVKILARLRLEEVELGFNPNAFPPEQFVISDVQLALLDHYLHGVVTLKGYKLINKYKQIHEED